MTIRPILVRDIAVYELPENIKDNEIVSVIETISNHSVTVKSLKPKAIFLSFKNIDTISQGSAKIFIDAFEKLGRDTKLITGGLNYTSKVFRVLEELALNTSLVLAKNMKIAALFLKTVKIGVNENILLFDDDKDAEGALYSDLISEGLSVVLAKDRKEFKAKAKSNQFTYKIYESRRNDKTSSVTTGFKTGFYFYELRGYLNDSIALDFDLKLHKHRLLEGFQAFFIDFSKVVSLNKKALNYIIEIAKISQKSNASIYIHDIHDEKIEKEQIESLRANLIKLYPTREDCFKHADAKGLIHKTRDLGDVSKLAISKESITRMPTYVRTVVEVLKTYGYNERDKVSTKPKISSVAKIVKDKVGLISFDGDLNATIMVFFTESQIQFVSENMFGGPTDNNDELKDLIAEVMNTVGGQIKLVTSNMNIPMSISLPEAFITHDDLIGFLDDRKGIMMEIKFNGEPLEIFLVGSVLLKVL